MRARCLRRTAWLLPSLTVIIALETSTLVLKKTRCRPFPPYTQGVQFIRRGKRRRLVCRLQRDRKEKQEQQPLPYLALSPVVRADMARPRTA